MRTTNPEQYIGVLLSDSVMLWYDPIVIIMTQTYIVFLFIFRVTCEDTKFCHLSAWTNRKFEQSHFFQFFFSRSFFNAN